MIISKLQFQINSFHGWYGQVIVIVSSFLLLSLFISCEIDSYEKGEGKYSLMQGEFCQLSVNHQKEGTTFITDEGVTYLLSPAVTANWIETPDTTYRTIIYFNKLSDTKAEPMAVGAVVTLHPIEHWRFKEQSQDPIGLESVWLSKNGLYLNVGLLMKTGRIDDQELPHTIGLAQDTVLVSATNKRTAYYRLLHSQNGIPAYYTNRRYISIALPQPRPDTICFTLQTYEGTLKKMIY